MFPCRDCLVRACCHAYCSKLLHEERVIALYLLTYNTCPDCGNQILEHSSDKNLIICKKCRKTFTKHLLRIPEENGVCVTSSSSTSGGSTSVQSKPQIFSSIPPEQKLGHIITGISKYHKVQFPKQHRNEATIQNIKDDSPTRPMPEYNRYITYRRMSPMYSEILINKRDAIARSTIENIKEEVSELIKKSEDWIFKYRDLFIKDPRQEENEENESSIYIN